MTAMFIIEGRLHVGGHARITWHKGQISAEPARVADLAREYARAMGPIGLDITPTGPFCSEDDLLGEALCALRLLEELFADCRVSGDVPQVPPVPPGAVA